MTPADIALDPIAAAVRALPIGRYVTDRCTPDGDCWRFVGSSNGHGYAQINRPKDFGRGLAHTMLWTAVNGPLGRRRLANTCGLRACCNPEHWRAMTPGQVISRQYASGERGSADRQYQAALKGHAARRVGRMPGSPQAVATAIDMREAGLTDAQIAEAMGVSQRTANYWARGLSWRKPSPFSGLTA
jgi:hypothetical protein